MKLNIQKFVTMNKNKLDTAIYSYFPSLLKYQILEKRVWCHPLSTYAKNSEKLTFLTP